MTKLSNINISSGLYSIIFMLYNLLAFNSVFFAKLHAVNNSLAFSIGSFAVVWSLGSLACLLLFWRFSTKLLSVLFVVPYFPCLFESPFTAGRSVSHMSLQVPLLRTGCCPPSVEEDAQVRREARARSEIAIYLPLRYKYGITYGITVENSVTFSLYVCKLYLDKQGRSA